MQVEGQQGFSLLSPLATGARVRNAYPTFPILLDSLPKGRLIQDGVSLSHVIETKDLSVSDGDAYH